ESDAASSIFDCAEDAVAIHIERHDARSVDLNAADERRGDEDAGDGFAQLGGRAGDLAEAEGEVDTIFGGDLWEATQPKKLALDAWKHQVEAIDAAAREHLQVIAPEDFGGCPGLFEILWRYDHADAPKFRRCRGARELEAARIADLLGRIE